MSIVLNKSRVYLDNAAATPLDKRVAVEMAKASNLYGNPSSFNNDGRLARNKLEESRGKIAKFLGARSEEIIFTSSGSEANNLVIQGLTGSDKGEVVTTPIEHLSILEPLKALEKKGLKVLLLKVNKEGLVDMSDLKSKLNPRVNLVSIIYANNEIGTIQDIKKISKVIRENSKAFLHIDACQAAEYLPMNVNELGVDLMTFNAPKIYGPKGIGVLYKKRGISIRPMIYGGGQEHGFRAGTENLPAIAGLAKAVELINKNKTKKTSKLRDYFIERIREDMPEVKLNGPEKEGRLPNNINISIPGLDSENTLLELDKYGISASSGSACTARSVEPSHVLRAIGVEEKYLNGAIRFSLGRQTTKEGLDYVMKILQKVVLELKTRYRKQD